MDGWKDGIDGWMDGIDGIDGWKMLILMTKNFTIISFIMRIDWADNDTKYRV
jgi:hypothetical protein